MNHKWVGEKSHQICESCGLERMWGAHGPRKGEGWSYYLKGGFIGFRTVNDAQPKCKGTE